MANADNNENTSGTQGKGNAPDPVAELNKKMDASFETLTEALGKLTTSVESTRQAAPAAQAQIDDDDVFDPKSLRDKIVNEVTATTREQLREEQRKNTVIYSLSQEYPEIHTDKELQKQVLKAQKELPKSMQDTAEGYEMAVLKAVANAGVLAKSKRPDSSETEVSISGTMPRGERSRKSSKQGLSEATIEFARLMGRDVDNPKVREALEKAANRDTFSRYR